MIMSELESQGQSRVRGSVSTLSLSISSMGVFEVSAAIVAKVRVWARAKRLLRASIKECEIDLNNERQNPAVLYYTCFVVVVLYLFEILGKSGIRYATGST
jgi:hypothetical protein